MDLNVHESSNLVHHINVFSNIISDMAILDVKIEDEEKTIILPKMKQRLFELKMKVNGLR